MERSCENCYHAMKWAVRDRCRWCLQYTDRPGFEERVSATEARRMLNYLYRAKPKKVLENMDMASLYPKTMICQDFGTRKPIKPLSNKVSYKSYADGFRPNAFITDEFQEYCKRDVEATKDLYEAHVRGRFTMTTKPAIKNVIFNDPATIIFWSDDTKTVVKCQEGDVFDPEKGLAMAICKKMMGNNQGRYFEEFKKRLPEKVKE